MPRGAAWLCLLVALAGCDDGADQPAATTTTSAPRADGLALGDEIVAAVTKASFRQGTIVKLDAAEVTFEFGHPADDGNKPRTTVPRDVVWKLGASPSAAAGDYAACKIAMTQREGALPSWYPCQIERLAAGKLRIVDHYGRKHELDPSDVIKPTEEIRKNVETYLATEARHRTFDRAFEQAGMPPRPTGWDPRKGEAVVIHFVGTSWYGGKVVENKRDKGKVRVSYDGGTWDDRDVPLTEIAPIPDKPADVKVGQFVISKPHTKSNRWEHNKVAAIDGDEVELINRDDNKRKVKRADLIPIVPKPAKR